MGIREGLNKHKNLSATVLGVFILGAIGYIIWSVSSAGAPTIPGKSYYTVDDGKTWFEDSLYKPVPFDREGKKALQAHVFTCGEKMLVPFVMRLSDNYLKEAQALTARRDENFGLKMENLMRDGLEVRRVGTDKWLPVNQPAAQKMMEEALKCPDGSMAQSVAPT